MVAIPILPYDKRILIRVFPQKSEQIKNHFRSVLNSIALIHSDSALPYIPK